MSICLVVLTDDRRVFEGEQPMMGGKVRRGEGRGGKGRGRKGKDGGKGKGRTTVCSRETNMSICLVVLTDDRRVFEGEQPMMGLG